MKPEAFFFLMKKIDKIHEPIARLARKTKRKTQITSIRNEGGCQHRVDGHEKDNIKPAL